MRINATRLATAVTLGLLATQPAYAQQGILGGIKDAAGTLWDLARSPFQRQSSGAVEPPTPIAVSKVTEGGHEFWDGLKDAGYELREIVTVVGIIPEAKLQFQLVRELSDADRDALERRIEIDEMRRGGLTAAIQRQILRTLLAASDLEEMRIVKLDITLLPLPSAEFIMEPAEAPLSEEHDAILQAVQGHSRELRSMSRGMTAPRTEKTAPGVAHD